MVQTVLGSFLKARTLKDTSFSFIKDAVSTYRTISPLPYNMVIVPVSNGIEYKH